MKDRQDRRIARTRAALIGAFNHLVLHRRQRRIRVADIVAQAKVGRSTFYEHYSSADEVMLEALRHPMAALADAASGRGELSAVTALLAHFWENRARARETVVGQLGDRVTRLLASMIEDRLGDRLLTIPRRLASLQLAEAALAPIRGWVQAEAPCTPEALADAIVRGGERLVSALTPELQ
jgi:AcrR family transcriptional regulator